MIPDSLDVKGKITGQCSSVIGPERCESAIISFSFELGHTRSPAACLSNGWRNPGCGLAFRDSECDNRLTGESPDRVHNVPPKRAEIGRIKATIRQHGFVTLFRQRRAISGFAVLFSGVLSSV